MNNLGLLYRRITVIGESCCEYPVAIAVNCCIVKTLLHFELSLHQYYFKHVKQANWFSICQTKYGFNSNLDLLHSGCDGSKCIIIIMLFKLCNTAIL